MVNNSIKYMMANEKLGSYYVHVCRNSNSFDNSEGSLFITYECNLYDP
jgi:hypothetical protein